MGLAFWKGGGGGGRTRLCLKLNVSGRKLDVNLKLSTQPLRGLSWFGVCLDKYNHQHERARPHRRCPTG